MRAQSERWAQPQGAISTAAELVERCRAAGVAVFHLAAAYRADLSDVPPLVLTRRQAMQSSGPGGSLRLPMLGDDALLPAITPAKVRTLAEATLQQSCSRQALSNVGYDAGGPRAESTGLLRQRAAG